MNTRAALICALLLLSPAVLAETPADPDEPKERAGEKEGPDLLNERARWFAERRRGADGRVPIDARNRALAEIKQNIAKGLLRPGPETRIPGDGWSPIGPMPINDSGTSYSGRVTAIAIHPTNANIILVGGAQGGVWKTIDHGATWAPISDTQASLAIGSIAFAPSNGNVIYAGTGEANNSCDSYFGAGILRSTDGGAHWTLVGQTPFANTSVSKILVHPGNPNILWASNVTGAGGFICYGVGGNTGVWRSTDAGATWLQVLGPVQLGGNTDTHDIVSEPANPNAIYAGVRGNGVWKTTNGGTGWTKLTTGLPTSNIGRIALAVDPVTPATVYAAMEAANTGRHLNTYKSTNSGSTWVAVTKPSGSCQFWTFSDICTYQGGSFGQCWYDLAIGVASDHSLWLGGTGIFRSADGGTNWSSICPSNVHVDQHVLAFRQSEAWIGNDGGVFSTTNNGASWTNRNPGLQLTQFYPGAALDPSNSLNALGGAQDNGCLRYSGSGTWNLQSTGDGAANAIDFTNPSNVWYVSTQYLSILKTVNGGFSYGYGAAGITDAGTGAAPFIAPYTMCPNNAQVLIAGSDNIWRTDNAATSWTSNSPDPLGSGFTSLAFARSTGNCDTYFAGDSGGRVFRTMNAGASWDNITSNLPPSGVSDVAVDPTNPAIVIVGLAGFSGGHVYRTANALDPTPMWTAIANGLPNAPANAVLIDPDVPTVYYVGTDVGIFRTLNSGGSWEVLMGGHPNVAVYDLVAESATGTIMSFTHGRGVFKLGTFCSDSDPCTTDNYDQTQGCIHAPLNCADADPCTVDSCSAPGGCSNVPLVCFPSDQCHEAGCDVGTGTCAEAEKLDGEPCDDTNACTQTDTCQTGVCTGSNPVPLPAEVDDGVRVDRSGTDALVTWNVAVGATSSDLLRGDLAALPVGPGGADELCFGSIAGSTATDADVPAAGAGYWYLVRGTNSCAGAGSYGDGRLSTTCP